MVSFPALPGRYQVKTPRCWPGTRWKATGTSQLSIDAVAFLRRLSRHVTSWRERLHVSES
jgi:hypothetical protein